MGQEKKSVSIKRSTRTVPAIFKKKDLVTFSDSCPLEFRAPFNKGPIQIVEVDLKKKLPYGIKMTVYYQASDLKLFKG